MDVSLIEVEVNARSSIGGASRGRESWATTSINSCAYTEHHHRTLIDQYGVTNPAEFLAVATETFFEKPRQLRAKHPGLHSQLQQFYCQDPAAFDTR
jgi:Mlc titration factor MtfA (ptsG expression regulator)